VNPSWREFCNNAVQMDELPGVTAAQQQGVAINLQLVRQPPQGCWFNCLSHMNLAQSIK
jgi:hypothetical protein